MKLTLPSIGLSVALASLLFADRTGQAETVRADGAPLAIPTFHCLGLYWSPPGGAYGPPEGDNDGRPVISVIIPEPITLSLLSLGALALLRRRR